MIAYDRRKNGGNFVLNLPEFFLVVVIAFIFYYTTSSCANTYSEAHTLFY